MNSEKAEEIALRHWQAVKHISVFLMKREWFGMAMTLLFALYMGSLLSFALNDFLEKDEPGRGGIILIDWMYLAMLPLFGQLMNRTGFTMWRDDYYTKRLAHWRTMPIPTATIVQARMLQMVVMLLLIGGIFLLLQYTFSPELRHLVSPLEWGGAGMLWICYALVINAVYILLELGYSGKQYVLFCLIHMAVMVAVSLLMNWQGVYVYKGVLRLTETVESAVPGIAVAALLAVLALWAGYRATLRRIERRSFHF